MPGQDRIGRNDRRDLLQHSWTEDLALDCEAPAFFVGEADPFALELVPENPILFLDVSDHVVLLPVDPASQSDQKKLPWV